MKLYVGAFRENRRSNGHVVLLSAHESLRVISTFRSRRVWKSVQIVIQRPWLFEFRENPHRKGPTFAVGIYEITFKQLPACLYRQRHMLPVVPAYRLAWRFLTIFLDDSRHCEFLSFRSGGAEVSFLLVHCAAPLYDRLPTFRDAVVVPKRRASTIQWRGVVFQ